MITECPHCRKRYNVRSEIADQSVNCSQCGRSFTVREHVTQLRQYNAADQSPPEPEEDDILRPPIQTPSYRETPVLRTSFTPDSELAASNGPAVQGQVCRRPAAPQASPISSSYLGLRIAAKVHTYGGIVALAIGLIVIVAGLDASSASADANGGTSPGVLYAWGFGVTAYGILALTMSRALLALRDIAKEKRGSGLLSGSANK